MAEQKNITSTWLERTRLEAGEVRWRGDPGCQGLRARISLGGKGARSMGWYYRYTNRLSGKLTAPFVIGQYPAMSLDEARTLVNSELRPLAETGADVKAEWKRQLRAVEARTLRQLIPDYLSFCEASGKAEGTVKSYRRYLRPVAHWWGDYFPQDINRGMCQDLFYRVQNEGVPPFDIDGDPVSGGKRTGGDRAAGLTHSASRGFWTYLVDRDLAPFNPWKEQKQLSRTGDSGIADRVLSDKEIRQALSHRLSHRDATLLRFMLSTGLRPNECCSATWSEIDLRSGVWSIPKGRMKYKDKGHTVYLSDYAVDILRAWRKTQKGRPRYVFPASGKHPCVQPDNLTERFTKIGLVGFTPKVCRSTFRTGLQRLGCPKEVREHMSHHQPGKKIERSYDHHDFKSESKDWWNKWGKHLSLLEEDNVVPLGGRA